MNTRDLQLGALCTIKAYAEQAERMNRQLDDAIQRARDLGLTETPILEARRGRIFMGANKREAARPKRRLPG